MVGGGSLVVAASGDECGFVNHINTTVSKVRELIYHMFTACM